MIDGMALVKKIKKTDSMRTCNDFAKAFVDYSHCSWKAFNISLKYACPIFGFSNYTS